MTAQDPPSTPPADSDPIRAARAEVGRPQVVPAEAADAAGAGERAGDVIGRYKLLQQIGEGGFGVVWMAEQSEPVRRKVALKVIKLGMDTRQVVARFEAERQALALMDHPQIAKVLDGGATDRGRPYFVMELVNGVPIVEYCDRNSSTIAERLALMTQVCHAVQHAHNKGIIHRDLKPSNVLVATQDGRPQAKVIDFGIAKATSQTLTEKTLFTEHRQVIGTLQYMSPEQAEGSLDVDTRTDVYSLGILLYELLTGSTPFDVRALQGALFGEIQRIIREVDPPRPSTRLSESADALAGIAARRGVEPRRLGVLLRGELDWIVMKALEKDRARRYETANALAMDLHRYLSGETVVAVPPSAAYRVRKFVRQNRAMVSAAAAVAVALLVGAAAFAWQAQLAREQRDLARGAQTAEAEQRRLADAQRDRAVQAEAHAQARATELQTVADFQAGMLEQLDPAAAGRLLSADVTARFTAALEQAGVPAAERAARVEAFRGEWARVNATDAARELIDRTILRPAIATLDAQFADQPLVDAQLRQVLADRYRRLGLLDAAVPLQTRALEARREALGDEHPFTLTSLDHLGLLLKDLGRFAEAEALCRQALETSRRVLGDDQEETLARITNVGALLEAQGRFAEAEPYYREALERHRRVLGEEHPETLTALNNMAGLLDSLGRAAEAERLYRDALEIARRVLGDEDRKTLGLLNNLGVQLHQQGRLAEAEPLYREALEGRRRVLGEEHPLTLGSLANLGALLKFQGKLAEAEPLYLEALELRRRVLGDEHPETLISLNNLGALLWAEDKLVEAEPLYREALEKKRRVLGDAHPSTLNSQVALGGLLEALGRPAEAVEVLAGAEEQARAAFGGENAYRVGRLLKTLGEAYRGLGELAAAESALLEAADILAEHPGPSAQDARECTQALVDLYAAWDAAEPGQGYDARSAEWNAKR